MVIKTKQKKNKKADRPLSGSTLTAAQAADEIANSRPLNPKTFGAVVPSKFRSQLSVLLKARGITYKSISLAQGKSFYFLMPD